MRGWFAKHGFVLGMTILAGSYVLAMSVVVFILVSSGRCT